jgi:type IV pilus assembly protein PilM
MLDSTTKVARPLIACEVTSHGVAAARVHHRSGSLEMMHIRSLPDGAVVPSLTAANVINPEALRTAILGAVTAVVGRPHELTAVLPDMAARVILLDFDTLPTKTNEADAAVRFRLKKALPFDAEHAAISYHVQRTPNDVRVIAAVMQASVRDEYENAFRDAGCAPSVVLPSTLATLGLVDTSEPALLLKVDHDATSVAIIDNDRLLLLRTLEGSDPDSVSAEQLADDVYPSLVYFQDTFGMNVKCILLAGVKNARELRPALESQTEVRVEDLVGASLTSAGGQSDFAGAIGALY